MAELLARALPLKAMLALTLGHAVGEGEGSGVAVLARTVVAEMEGDEEGEAVAEPEREPAAARSAVMEGVGEAVVLGHGDTLPSMDALPKGGEGEWEALTLKVPTAPDRLGLAVKVGDALGDAE